MDYMCMREIRNNQLWVGQIIVMLQRILIIYALQFLVWRFCNSLIRQSIYYLASFTTTPPFETTILYLEFVSIHFPRSTNLKKWGYGDLRFDNSSAIVTWLVNLDNRDVRAILALYSYE